MGKLLFSVEWWKNNWGKVVGSIITILAYFAALFSAESFIGNNSLSTLANGTSTIGFILLMLKIWVIKPNDKSWVETSKEVLDFWQAVLVVTAFLLLIYHWHVKNFIKNIFPDDVVIVANVWDETSNPPSPIPNCNITLKFLDETVIELKTNAKGVLNKTQEINKKAAQGEVVVIVHKERFTSNESVRRVSNDSLDIGAIPLSPLE
jgi:amino acid transporter